MFAARRHTILDYRHKQLGLIGRRVAISVYWNHDTSTLAHLSVPVDSEDYDFTQGVDLGLVGAFLECIAKILC